MLSTIDPEGHCAEGAPTRAEFSKNGSKTLKFGGAAAPSSADLTVSTGSLLAPLPRFVGAAHAANSRQPPPASTNQFRPTREPKSFINPSVQAMSKGHLPMAAHP